MLKNLKRVLSVVLVFCMIMSMLSMTALADTQDEESVVPAGEEVMDQAEDQDDETDTPEVEFPIDGGNFIVDFDAASGTYVVTFTGTGWLSANAVNTVKAKLEEVGIEQWAAVIGSGVTTIEQSAFNPHGGSYDTTLTSVEIGENVTTIGKWAFWGCEALESVTFASGSKWTGEGGADAQFQFCTSLTSIELPDSLTKIPGYCFSGSGLTGIEIPDSVGTIEENAFKNCTSLTEVTFNDGLETIGLSAFEGCSELAVLNAPGDADFPDSLKTINGYAFKYCTALASIRFPKELERIGVSAFESSGVTQAPVVLPDSLTNMGDYVFSGLNFVQDKDKEIYYEGYTVHGYWSNSRVFCLNGGHYDYDAGSPVENKLYHAFVGWHKVDPMNPDELEKVDELDASTLVLHEDGTKAGIGEVMDTGLFPAGYYYFAEWTCQFETTREEPTCVAPGKVIRECKSPDCDVRVVTEIPATGNHKWSETATETKEYTEIKNDTEYNVVEKNYPCTVCNAPNWDKTSTPVPHDDEYIVTFDGNGREIDIDPVAVKVDTALGGKMPADPVPDSGKFVKWTIDPEGTTEFTASTVVDHNMTVYAQWKYTLTYVSDGVTVKTEELAAGAAIGYYEPDGKNRFVFDKWNPEVPETMPNHDVTVEAVWIEMCMVTFDSNGGSFVGRAVRGVEVVKGSTLKESGMEMPAVVRDGYELTGWQDENGNEFTVDTPVVGDMVVKAQWLFIDQNTPEPSAPIPPVTPVTPITPVTPSQPNVPDEDIPDDNPPLVGEPDDEPPLSGDPDDEDIPDDEPPLSGEPDDEEIPDDEPPLSGEPDVEDIPDDEPPVAGDPSVLVDEGGEEITDGGVPLADVPQTGDGLVMWLSVAALSGAGLVLVTVSERKRKEQSAE